LEVRIIDLRELNCSEDDAIVMGTDGLWDVTENNTAANIIFNTVDQYPTSDPLRLKYKYISAAQDLVMHARGKYMDRNWKMADGSGNLTESWVRRYDCRFCCITWLFYLLLVAATIDDISVFVIPIWPYKTEIAKYELPASIYTNGNGLHSDEPDVNDNNSSSVLNGEEVDLLVRPLPSSTTSAPSLTSPALDNEEPPPEVCTTDTKDPKLIIGDE